MFQRIGMMGAVALVAFAAGAATDKTVDSYNSAFVARTAWIWTPEKLPERNSYVEFRRSFVGDGKPMTLRVAAAGEFCAELNGAVATFGTYRDFPDHPAYNEVVVPTRIGTNELAVGVFHSGNGFGSHADGLPGFWCEALAADGTPLAASGERGWLCRPMRNYSFGERAVTFGTLDFTFEYDARTPSAAWREPVAAAPHAKPVKRPVAAPHLAAPIVAREIYREKGAIGFDLGTIACGWLEFRVKAPKGTRLKILNREYLTEGRVKCIGGVQPGDWYVSDGNEATFCHRYRYIGCRYLAFEFEDVERKFKTDALCASVHDVKLLPAVYDGFETPPFDCDDEFFNRLHKACAKTLRLCWMGRHVSNVWREQAWYPYDVRFEALYDYTLWGLYGETAANLEQIGRGVLPNGYAPCVGPAVKPDESKRIWIPMYTFAWMASLAEHYRYSGDDRLFVRFAAQFKDMLAKALANRKDGLYLPPEGAMRWDYCDPAMEDWVGTPNDPPNAFYNLYARETLLFLAPLYRSHGDAAYAEKLERIADEIGKRCVERYWDADRGYFADRIDKNGKKIRFHSHVQYLFLVQGLVPPADRRAFIDRLLKFELPFGSYASLTFLCRAILEYGTEAQLERFHAYVKELYRPMLDGGFDTIWESPRGTAYGGGTGCVCQGWAAFPAWYEAHVLLGVRPTKPGFAEYERKPRLLGGMKRISGRVMTPRGPVDVSASADAKGDAFLTEFRTPPPGYGEVPFWWWTGEKLDKKRIAWQIEELHRKGISGTQVNYSHLMSNGWPTAPVEPAIFSDEWWDCFAFAAEESAKRGMGIGLSCYTLDWPSRRNNLFKKLGITAPDTRARTIGPIGGGRFAPAVRDGTLDPLNPESARRVIDRFFRPFWERVPASARGALNYFFQDELSLAGGWIWSDDFPDEFRKRKGYDIVPKLPLLFAKQATDEVMKTRLDYNDVMTDLMGERYFRPIYDWHASRGLIYACDPSSRGHDPCEFGDYMKAIRWYTAPGYDVPWASADPVKGKMASSISHLYGRPRVWMEGYHSLGWQAAPEQLFASTAANYALGANLLNLHGLYYTTYGGWWEWAPPCYHFRQPYWKSFGAMLKYYERLSYALTRGVHVCDIAIVTPQAPLVADSARARKTSVPIAHRLVHRLANDGATDCDFIDAESLAKATVEKDALGTALAVAGERYRVILLPDMFAMRETSKAKLAAFRAAGGRVIEVNDLEAVKTLKFPLLENPDVRAPAGVKVNHRRVAQNVDAESLPRQNKEGLLFSRRGKDSASTGRTDSASTGMDLYFFAGLPANAVLDLRTTGTPFVLDPWTGEKIAIERAAAVTSCETASGRTRLTVDGESLAAGALLLGFESVDAESLPRQNKEGHLLLRRGKDSASTGRTDAASTIALDGSWRMTLVPTLDNRWGDFRMPATAETIGAEVRRMHWVEQNIDQNLNYGPQFLVTTNSSAALASSATPPASKNNPPLSTSTSTSTSSLCSFSWRYGVFGKPGNQDKHHGLNERVGDGFLIMGPYSPGEYYDMRPSASEMNLVSTFSTFVYAPNDLTARIVGMTERPYDVCGGMGCPPPALESLTVGGVPHKVGEKVALKAGYTPVEMRYRGCGRAAVVFVDDAASGQSVDAASSPRRTKEDSVHTDAAGAPRPRDTYPLSMKWLTLPGRLSYDPFGGRMKKGTFTATVPPGTVDADVAVRGRLLRKEIKDGTLTVEVEYAPGFVGGNCFEREIKLKVAPFEAALGDWARWEGLRCYSGGMTYEKEFDFERRGRDSASTGRKDSASTGRVVLDLGRVGCCAEVRLNGGRERVLVTSPWKLDVTDDLRDGKNRLSITVYNTLNNHYQTIPTRYKVSTERCPSGLLGPVALRR